jgi:hypothetical protein
VRIRVLLAKVIVDGPGNILARLDVQSKELILEPVEWFRLLSAVVIQ